MAHGVSSAPSARCTTVRRCTMCGPGNRGARCGDAHGGAPCAGSGSRLVLQVLVAAVRRTHAGYGARLAGELRAGVRVEGVPHARPLVGDVGVRVSRLAAPGDRLGVGHVPRVVVLRDLGKLEPRARRGRRVEVEPIAAVGDGDERVLVLRQEGREAAEAWLAAAGEDGAADESERGALLLPAGQRSVAARGQCMRRRGRSGDGELCAPWGGRRGREHARR